MKEPIYKDWKEWCQEDAFVKVDVLEQRLDDLSTYNEKLDNVIEGPKHIDSATNYILKPCIGVIKEYNTTFVELMKNHSHKYNTSRIVPIHIIRGLIDVGAALCAYIESLNKKQYAEEYHKGKKYAGIDNKNLTHYIKLLNNQFSFVWDLYTECCSYVHTNYVSAKSRSAFDYRAKPGRIGFMGEYYKVKKEDFISDLVDGIINESDIPFDYEEEVDITSYCIKVNNMLVKLVGEVKNNDYKL